MIASMTAFARCMHEASWGTLVWEVRCVNHRYLDISLRMPDITRQCESAAREVIQQYLKRGKVEASLKFQAGAEAPVDFVINDTLLQKLGAASQKVKENFTDANVSVMDVLAWPGVVESKEMGTEEIQVAALSLLQTTMKEITATREREGFGIRHFILERLAHVRLQMDVVTSRFPEVQGKQRQRIIDKFNELRLELDTARLEQEITWLIQKADIAEELQRLDAHLAEVKRVMEQGDVVGRRLDFLMQELNREANTLSSKSIDAEVTQAAVEIKVSIEQMREQVQNIE